MDYIGKRIEHRGGAAIAGIAPADVGINGEARPDARGKYRSRQAVDGRRRRIRVMQKHHACIGSPEKLVAPEADRRPHRCVIRAPRFRNEAEVPQLDSLICAGGNVRVIEGDRNYLQGRIKQG